MKRSPGFPKRTIHNSKQTNQEFKKLPKFPRYFIPLTKETQQRFRSSLRNIILLLFPSRRHIPLRVDHSSSLWIKTKWCFQAQKRDAQSEYAFSWSLGSIFRTILYSFQMDWYTTSALQFDIEQLHLYAAEKSQNTRGYFCVVFSTQFRSSHHGKYTGRHEMGETIIYRHPISRYGDCT